MLIYVKELDIILNTDDISTVESIVTNDDSVEYLEQFGIESDEPIKKSIIVTLKSNKRQYILDGSVEDFYYQLNPSLKNV